MAISLRQGGLVNPAIHDVDKKSLDEVMESMLDLVNRACSGHLRSSELSDGTITVMNLGEQGVADARPVEGEALDEPGQGLPDERQRAS